MFKRTQRARLQDTAAGRGTDRLSSLIASDQIGPWFMVVAVILAIGLGAIHALSPGHGKAIVAGYLVGSRGTARHAFFLGLTVTITHTLGVFSLGLITLYASRYILPEQLYPWLGVLSGLLVVVMGMTLGMQRLQALRAPRSGAAASDEQAHQQAFGLIHEHGPNTHTHMPRTRNGRVTWKSLLTAGRLRWFVAVSIRAGSDVQCHRARRVGFGLLLIVAFSVGLAGSLTGIGLLFVYGTRWIQRMGDRPLGGWTVRVIPIGECCLRYHRRTCYHWQIVSGSRTLEMVSKIFHRLLR